MPNARACRLPLARSSPSRMDSPRRRRLVSTRIMDATHAAARAGPGVRGGWLYGPATDLLLGAGAGYLVSIPLLVLWGGAAGFDSWPSPSLRCSPS